MTVTEMNLAKIYIEEDLFPREIASWEQRDYGFLFYSQTNKDSYDSNHAVIFRDQIDDIDGVLDDLVEFYKEKGITPSIYQSISDDGYFAEIEKQLAEHGFDCWTEPQKYMVLTEKNTIIPNPAIAVQRVSEWDDEYSTEIFEKAGEPWEIDVAKNSLHNSNTLFFVAFHNNRPVGMTRCHITDGVCRVDYLLVSKESRNIGVGRALIHCFVEYCNTNETAVCYLWPDGDTAEKIYYEAGFRHIETKLAGRAAYKDNIHSTEKP